MSNPYQKLESRAFWKTSVASVSAFDIKELWVPKFPIRRSHKVTTYGSCFAQHFGRSLSNFGFQWNISEQAPNGLSNNSKKLFNYDVFSSRTGNIYTTSLLLQWIKWSLDSDLVPEDVWEEDGRYFDPFRPAIEPNGFASKEELLLSRNEVLKSFKASILTADVFVFTLGLTERWRDRRGFEYPMCPGTVAGDFDPSVHLFSNMTFVEVRRDLIAAMDLLRELNPQIKVLLTVSPVPLTATYSDRHALVATTASKSILRAVADDVCGRQGWIDYFPSYEIITGIPFKSMFYEPNLRSVNPAGVKYVMESFFNDLSRKYPKSRPAKEASSSKLDDADVACEEELLEAFGGKL